jgi:CheY-like chemotaxis protein
MGTPRLLLVEDNPGDVELLRLAFDEAGHEVEIVTARDGREALKILEQAGKMPCPPFGIIVLDLNVPIINGIELLARIREDPRLAAVPTVVLTSSSSPVDRGTSVRLQASAYLIKPVSFGDYAAITKLLWSHLDKGQTASR